MLPPIDMKVNTLLFSAQGTQLNPRALLMSCHFLCFSIAVLDHDDRQRWRRLGNNSNKSINIGSPDKILRIALVLCFLPPFSTLTPQSFGHYCRLSSPSAHVDVAYRVNGLNNKQINNNPSREPKRDPLVCATKILKSTVSMIEQLITDGRVKSDANIQEP